MNIKMRVKDGQLQVKSSVGWLNVNKSDSNSACTTCRVCHIRMGECPVKEFSCGDFYAALGYRAYLTKPKKKKKKLSPEFIEALKNVEVGDEVKIKGSNVCFNGIHTVSRIDSDNDIVIYLGFARRSYRIKDGKYHNQEMKGEGRIVAIRKKSEWIKR